MLINWFGITAKSCLCVEILRSKIGALQMLSIGVDHFHLQFLSRVLNDVVNITTLAFIIWSVSVERVLLNHATLSTVLM